MAITAVGSLGSSHARDTGRTLTLTPSSTVPADNVVVVWFAHDSIWSIFVPTFGQFYYRCTDSVGNIYTLLLSQTDQEPFFRLGAHTSMFISQLRVPLTTSDHITIETDPSLGQPLDFARAMSAEEFDFHGSRWAAHPVQYRSVNNVGPPDTVSLNTDYGDIEWLWLHALASKGPNTDVYTGWGADGYTEIAGDGTNTGTPTDDMSVRGGYKIDNITLDSFAVSTGTDRRVAQVFRPIAAVPRVDDFPVSPILDDYNRANENPLDGGLWDTGVFAYGSAHLQLLSNEARGASGGFQGGSFFDEEMENCVEVYVTFNVGQTASIHYHSIHDSSTATMEGYGAGWAKAPFEQSQDYFDHINVGSSGLQGFVPPDQLLVWVDLHDGFRLGCQMSYPTGLPGAFNTPTGIHHRWVDIGNGWEWVCAFIDRRPVVGRLALGIQHGSAEMDDFGGGEIPCFTGRTQIYRILEGTKPFVPA